jgi:class 3 adenylate cyclase
MTFDEILGQVLQLLQRQGRVSYRALKRRFALDDEYLEDLKAELIKAQRVAVDEDGDVLVWTGGDRPPPLIEPEPTPPPLSYTPAHLAEKILTSRSALEGERKQVTVLFSDLKGSMELLADRDPEDARQLLDPVLERMMAAVHHYEGTVNQVMGDGIMALFGAPIAHEDHAVRACYAALAMQTSVKQYAAEVQRTRGVPIHIRVGLNSGEVEVKGLAQLGATLGREFAYELLQAVSPWDEDTVQRGLHQLVEAEFLYQQGLPPQATYRFKHALIQDAAYQSLLRSTRQQSHQRVAQSTRHESSGTRCCAWRNKPTILRSRSSPTMLSE